MTLIKKIAIAAAVTIVEYEATALILNTALGVGMPYIPGIGGTSESNKASAFIAGGLLTSNILIR